MTTARVCGIRKALGYLFALGSAIFAIAGGIVWQEKGAGAALIPSFLAALLLAGGWVLLRGKGVRRAIDVTLFWGATLLLTFADGLLVFLYRSVAESSSTFAGLAYLLPPAVWAGGSVFALLWAMWRKLALRAALRCEGLLLRALWLAGPALLFASVMLLQME